MRKSRWESANIRTIFRETTPISVWSSFCWISGCVGHHQVTINLTLGDHTSAPSNQELFATLRALSQWYCCNIISMNHQSLHHKPESMKLPSIVRLKSPCVAFRSAPASMHESMGWRCQGFMILQIVFSLSLQNGVDVGAVLATFKLA